MAAETKGLTSEWVEQMEERGFLTSDDIADLMDDLSSAQEALFERGNPGPLCGLVKRYYESEKHDGSNFRTLFGATLVFARQVDADMEENILTLISHGLSAFAEGMTWDGPFSNVLEYTENSFLNLMEAVFTSPDVQQFDLEY